MYVYMKNMDRKRKIKLKLKKKKYIVALATKHEFFLSIDLCT